MCSFVRVISVSQLMVMWLRVLVWYCGGVTLVLVKRRQKLEPFPLWGYKKSCKEINPQKISKDDVDYFWRVMNSTKMFPLMCQV